METTNGAVIILGSKNDERGEIVPNGKLRIEKAIEVYKANIGYKLLATGGFGARFNTTGESHAYHAKQYMLQRGISEEDILPLAESMNTIEDAKISKKIIDETGVKNIIVVTSDYHAMRSRIIFKKVFGKEYIIKMIRSKNCYGLWKLSQFRFHEIRQTIKILLGIIRI